MPDTELCKKGTDGLKTRLTLVLLKDPCRCSGQKIFCSFNIRTNSVGSLQPQFITYRKLTGYTMVKGIIGSVTVQIPEAILNCYWS